MNTRIITIAAFLLGCMVFNNPLLAQEVKKLSLKEVVELGLQNSKHLKIDQAKIQEAAAAVEEAKNHQLPDFKVTGSYMRLTNANVDLKAAKSGSGSSSGSSGGSSFPTVSQAMYGIANVSLPLYAGGKIRYGIESSKYLLEAVRLNEGNDKNAIAYNLTEAYANLFKSAQLIGVIRENLAASQHRDSNFLQLENNGLMARNDRLKAQLQTSDIELQLLEAQNNNAIANVNMDLLLGLPETTLIEVDSTFIIAAEEQPVTYYEAQAIGSRKDMQALSYQEKAAQTGIKAARADYFPSLALTGGYIAADIPKVLTITNAINGGIGVQYSLSSLWKTGASIRKAKAQVQELTASRDLLTDNIRLEINRDYQNALLAKKKIDVNAQALTQAEENYRITKNKYDNSLVTITDLLDANASLLSSRIKLLNAKADAALASQKLLEASGILIK